MSKIPPLYRVVKRYTKGTTTVRRPDFGYTHCTNTLYRLNNHLPEVLSLTIRKDPGRLFDVKVHRKVLR